MDNEVLYRQRAERIEKAIKLEPVDRIPVVFMGQAFAPQYMGITMAEYVNDLDAAVSVTIDTLKRLGDLEGINMMVSGGNPVMLALIWLSRVKVPGRELPENALWQVHEAEVMTIEDYDALIEMGWGAFQQSYAPRVVIPSDMAILQEQNARTPSAMQQLREAGYVSVSGGATTIPFEPLCGGRSMTRFFFDLHRIPDKVQAAMDVMLPDMIKMGIGAAMGSGIPRVWVGGWRSASAFLAPKLWDRFVWPYFYQVVTALAENNVASILHLDQDWTRDLPRLLELPKGMCLLNPDGATDIRKFKEVAGDHMAVMGDVPASLFAAGTPDDIYNYVRDLVRDIGPTGLILCPGCDAPINTKPENMEAFVAAGREYGTL